MTILREKRFGLYRNRFSRWLNRPGDLQSHGFVEAALDRPVNTRFVTYELSDEYWMRPLGLGSVKLQPADLYDVRDEIGRLVGYSKTSPSSFVDKGCRFGTWHVNGGGFVEACVKTFEMCGLWDDDGNMIEFIKYLKSLEIMIIGVNQT